MVEAMTLIPFPRPMLLQKHNKGEMEEEEEGNEQEEGEGKDEDMGRRTSESMSSLGQHLLPAGQLLSARLRQPARLLPLSPRLLPSRTVLRV